MNDPFIGTWELDAATLHYESGRPGKRASYVITAIPNGLLFLLDGEDAEGRPIRFQYGGALDGSVQRLPGESGLTLMLKRENGGMIESVLMRDDKVLDRWTRELTADRQAIKITQYVANPNGGYFQNSGLYRRVTD